MTNKIETDRLILRPLNINDSEFTLSLLNSSGWLEFIGDRGIRDIQAAEIYLADKVFTLYEKYGYGPYGVRTKEDETLTGFCGLFKRDFLEDPDIGFAFLPEFTGRGYAIESAIAVIEDARTELGLKKVAAITLEKNIRSINVLKKLGMQFERNIIYPESKEELMLYSINFE
jgi:RimJ/RimL family protein N-acetyltransferase